VSLTPAFLDELRARTLLSSVVGRAVKLTRAGREWKACCPFHNEKTPSFTVNDEKGFYHCFGCGAHGDAIRFLTENGGLGFMDAVKELAEACGMTVPAPDPRAREKAERAEGLHDVMAAAAGWFGEQLDGKDGGEARAYLDRRGVSPAMRQAFGLGFAPDSRGRLKTALARFGGDKLLEAGLLVKPEDEREPYDRFRGRLIIPIRDPRGRVIAFGGRVIGTGEPKYLNSPDTPLFDKGRTLYNLDRAGPAARKAGRIIVVEGYMDVIALAQAGFDEVVAPLGTALTEMQLERLWRITDVPILCFDGDGAGQRAAMRAALRALPMLAPSRSLAFATLPAGIDPDDLVRGEGGPQAFAALLASAEPLVERLWRAERDAQPLTTPEARAGLRQRLMAHAAAVQDRSVGEEYRLALRGYLDTLHAPARGGAPAGTQRRFYAARPLPPSASAQAVSRTGTRSAQGRAILAGLLAYPELVADYAEAIAGLAMGRPQWDALRDVLVDCALSGETLDTASIDPILQAAGVAGAADEVRRPNGLAFSFTRGNAEPERARRDLAAMIEAMAELPQLDAAFAAASARLREGDGAAFAEKMRLGDRRRAAMARLAAMARDED
jgi:DNA primase